MTRAESKLLALGARVERVGEEPELVLEIFGAMCPALPEHELTLSGWRKVGRERAKASASGHVQRRDGEAQVAVGTPGPQSRRVVDSSVLTGAGAAKRGESQ